MWHTSWWHCILNKVILKVSCRPTALWHENSGIFGNYAAVTRIGFLCGSYQSRLDYRWWMQNVANNDGQKKLNFSATKQLRLQGRLSAPCFHRRELAQWTWIVMWYGFQVCWCGRRLLLMQRSFLVLLNAILELRVFVCMKPQPSTNMQPSHLQKKNN